MAQLIPLFQLAHRWPRLAAGALAMLVVSAALAVTGASRQTDRDDTPVEALGGWAWPGGGSAMYQREQLAVQRTAADRLQRFPDSPNTVGWLVRARRTGDALTVLERIVQRHPEHVAAAVQVLDTSEIQRDQGHGYKARAKVLLAAARAKLASLDRERAAQVAVALLALEQVTADAHEDYDVRLGRVLAEYRGTETARLAEVGRFPRTRLTPDWLARLDEIAAGAPGTVVAAKARHTKAFHLARNYNNLVLSGANPDPADAFLEVLAIVADLESGRYPACKWVDEASELVTGYFMFQPKLTPESAMRMLDGMSRFVDTHTALLASPQDTRTPNYLITGTMPRVAAFLPNGSDVMARQFDRFEREWPDPAPAKLLRATWLDTRPGNSPGPAALPPPSDTREAEVRALIASAATSTNPVYARRALARLAEREFADPASLTSAHAHFTDYLRRFPQAPDAWAPAIRLGQVEQAQGRTAEAVASFVRAAVAHPDDAFVRALALAYAGRLSEEGGAFDAAARHYDTAAEAWVPELGEVLSLDLPLPPNKEPVFPADPLAINQTVVRRETLLRRVAEIGRSLPVAGGAELERGRWLLSDGRSAAAVPVLAAVARRYAGNSVGAEARTLLRRARLDAAVARASSGSIPTEVAAALDDLDLLSREPLDAASGTAGIVAATIRLLRGQRGDADRGLRATLDRWVGGATPVKAPPAPASVEADVLAIRDAVFQPLGHATLGQRWNASEWPAKLPPFVVALGTLRVTTVDGAARDVEVSRQPSSLSNVVFMTSDDVQYLTRTVSQLGGTNRRAPTSIMQVPNQPIGGAQEIVQWWNRFFPARPGHWGGFEILTYPAFSSIEFTNAQRTRALVPIAVGYSGATVVLEKVQGVWTMKELVNYWIT